MRKVFLIRNLLDNRYLGDYGWIDKARYARRFDSYEAAAKEIEEVVTLDDFWKSMLMIEPDFIPDQEVELSNVN